jgi:glycosyltransferase involved in cell wall biosynthesis
VSGALPRHQLFGADYLRSQGCEVDFVDSTRTIVSRSLRRLKPGVLGHWLDPAQFARAAARAVQEDATIYALQAFSLGTVPLARLLGRKRPKIAALVHEAFSGRYPRFLARYVDGAACLTDDAAETMTACGLEAVTSVGWGPDLEFRGYECAPPDGFSIGSLGRTARDFETLLHSLEIADVPAVVDVPLGTGLPSKVRTLQEVAALSGVHRFDAWSYHRAVAGFRHASAFAIPLQQPFGGPVGLTEVNDALALGRPVVMTRTPGLGFDIEAEGFGIWVEPHDVDGFARAIAALRDDESMAVEMGRNARAFAESKWNYGQFSRDVDRFLVAYGL